MSDSRQIKSFWWSPARADSRWFGTLTLRTGESLELELFGERQSVVGEPPQFEGTIHGMDEHGAPITLLHVSPLSRSITGAISKRTFNAGYVLIGATFPDAKSFSANSLRLQVQHLYGWLGRSGFQESPGMNRPEFTVCFRPPEDQWFSIKSDLEIGVLNTFSVSNGFQAQSISEDVAIAFRGGAGFSLSHCHKLADAMRMLLHFALLKPVFLVSMTGHLETIASRVGDHFTNQDVEIINADLRETKETPPFSDFWIFRFEDVSKDFSGFFGKWLDYREKFVEPLDCYSATIYHQLPTTVAHLSLTQALEAYHGMQFSSHKKHDFGAKITDLCNLHVSSLKGLVDDIPDFTERVLCSRNHYTHHNPKWMATGKVATGVDLIRLNEKLKLLFQMCVLTDLEIPAERFLRLRRQLASEIISYL